MVEALTPEKILETAEQVLRRFGPGKTTVVDVARALGVSHGSVYRHFASKADLRDAVVEQWLKRTSEPLEQIANSQEPPRQRLRQWFDALIAAKRAKVVSDPELFAMSREIFAAAHEVVARHVSALEGQVAAILRDGVARGDFALDDVEGTARAIFDATVRFHDPAHAAEWTSPGIDQAYERVWALVMATLASKP
jgi:AcrR family transcriptional regulator